MTDIENREKNDFENEDADDLLSRDPEEASRALERITQIFAEANERDNLPERDPENPDNYYFESVTGKPSRTLAYKQIGNAVPVELARRIGVQLVVAISEVR